MGKGSTRAQFLRVRPRNVHVLVALADDANLDRRAVTMGCLLAFQYRLEFLVDSAE
jgi:hypothetical protein